MKGFLDEFTEQTNGMTVQIAELNSQLKEKEKIIEELKEELSLKDKLFNEHKDMLTSLGKQLSKEKIEGIKKDKTILELGKHESKISMELMRVKNEVNAIKQALETKGDE